MKVFCQSIFAAVALLSFCGLDAAEGKRFDDRESCYTTSAGWAEADESESLELEDDDALIDWKPSVFSKADKFTFSLHGPWAHREFLREVVLPPPQGNSPA